MPASTTAAAVGASEQMRSELSDLPLAPFMYIPIMASRISPFARTIYRFLLHRRRGGDPIGPIAAGVESPECSPRPRRILWDMMTTDCINPATEERLGPAPVYSASQIEGALAKAATGFEQWRGVSKA